MTIEDTRTSSAAPEPVSVDVTAEARQLITGLAAEPWGRSSPSIYETGRLVASAPWLTGHPERVEYLVREQRPDGGWGVSDGYDLVPTLSATQAVLTVATGGDAGENFDASHLLDVADRGLRTLRSISDRGADSLPDTPAIDIIVPALVTLVNDHLDRLRDQAGDGRYAWRDRRLSLPPGMSPARFDAVRRLLANGAAVPEKLLHALEIGGELAYRAPGVQPKPPGTVGASPAATAAWLGAPATSGADAEARGYLEVLARRQSGPVPCAMPITVFERAWVLAGLARAGVPVPVSAELRRSLAVDLGPAGTPAGPGLPPDADTTSVALYALALLDAPIDPDSLWAYDTGEHFCTWPGEDGYSVSTNAHVLDSLGKYLDVHPKAGAHYLSAVDRLSRWLCEQQRPDGSWHDRWHASPYYATTSCVLALTDHGVARNHEPAPAVRERVRRAVAWVLDTQRQDGSWGRWSGTVEETAYAVQTLAVAGDASSHNVRSAVRAGYRYLSTTPIEPVPLWHDKDLYHPATIVRAAVLSAMWVVRRRPQLLQAGPTS